MPLLLKKVKKIITMRKSRTAECGIRERFKNFFGEEKCFNSRRYALQKKIVLLSTSFMAAAEEHALPALILSAEGAQLRPAVIAITAKMITARILSAKAPAESFFAEEYDEPVRE